MEAQKVLRRRAAMRGIFCLAGVALFLWFVSLNSFAQNSTVTVVGCTPSSVVVDQSTTCTVTVTDTAQTPSTPTGDVTFNSSGTGSFSPSSTCTLVETVPGSEAECSVTYTPTAFGTGTHTITANYLGDAGHNGSSGSFDLTVNLRATQTTVSCTSPVVPTQDSTCTVTVVDNETVGTSSTPQGTVTFSLDPASDGSGTFPNGNTCNLDASGQCSVTYRPSTANDTTDGASGTHIITADYGGSSVHAASSGSFNVQVNPRQTSTSVSCPASAFIDETITCTATVTDTDANGTPSTPQGTVTFSSSSTGTFPSGNTCTLDAAGQCSVQYTPSDGSAGTHTLTGDYSGSSVHATSSGSANVTVNLRTTSTTVVCTPSPIVVSQQTTCTATVIDTATGSASPPSGTVTFSRSGDGSGSFAAGSCTLAPTGNPGESSCSDTYTPSAASGTDATPGTHTITATYGGSTTHNGSSNSVDVTVNPRQTRTTVSCTSDFLPNFVDGGSTVTCTATVTDIDPSGTKSAPSGTVLFTSSGSGTFSNPGASCSLTATGADTSQCSVDYTPAAGSDGTHTITGAYGGSTVHDASSGNTDLAVDDTSPTITSTITGLPKYPAGCNPPSTCFVTSATDINVNVIDPTVNGVSSGLASCTIDITGPASASPACTAGDNTFRLDAALFGATPPDGTYTISISATDNVGNSSNSSFQVTLDNTAPDNYVENLGTPNYTSGGITYVKSTTPINVTGDDGSGSGIADCTLEIDGGGANPYTLGTDFTLPTPDGPHTYSVICTDNLGNTSAPFSRTRTVDDTPPGNYSLTIGTPSYSAGGKTYVASDTNPQLSPTDLSVTADDGSGSGIAGPNVCDLDIDDGTGFQPYTLGTTFHLKAPDGPKNWQIQCTDNLGNQSTFTQPLIVDDTPPEIAEPRHQNTTCYPANRCAAGSEALVGGTYVKALDQASITPAYPFVPASTFDYPSISDPPAGTEPGSGVASCTLSGTQSDGTYPGETVEGLDFRIAPGDGSKTFSLTCRDNLGNSSTRPSPTLNVDDTPPAIPNNLSHNNTTCYPFDRCKNGSEIVTEGTYVKAVDKLPFTPSNPLLPSYPQFIPRSTFQWLQTDANGTIEDPLNGGVASGLRDCVLTGGTTLDNVLRLPPFTEVFSATVGDGPRTFRNNCRDNLGNQAYTDGATIYVDDTPPAATFITAGPRYDDPTDGTIFVESNTLITPVLTDAGVGVDLNGSGGPPADIGPTNPPCLQNQDQNAVLIQRCMTSFTFPPPDRDHHLWIIRPDLLGNVAEGHFIFIVDDTPPKVEISTPIEQAQYLLNSEVLADWNVTDDISFFEGPVEPPFAPGLVPRGSGIREIIVTTPKGEPIDTWGVGAKVFTLIAVDNLGHQTVAQVTYHVVYAFAIDPALEAALAEGRYTAGSGVPLSFWLGDAHGTAVTDAQPQIRLFTAQGEEISLAPNGKPVFARYDPELNRYVYILDTRQLGLGPGDYEIWIQPGDATTHKLKLTLR